MPSRWDLRKTLNVDPENKRLCAGWATSQGRECRNPINISDRATAGRILDNMDRAKRLLDSLDDLEPLACLLLCKSWHNPTKRSQSYSQVREVTQKWIGVVIREDEKIRIKSAKLLKAQRELTKMNDNIRVMVEEVEEAVEAPRKTVKPSKRAETVSTQSERSAIPVYRDDPFTNGPNANATRANPPDKILSQKSTNVPISFKGPPATASKPLSASVFPQVPTNLPAEKNGRQMVPTSGSPTKVFRDAESDNTMEALRVLKKPIELEPMKEVLHEYSGTSYNCKDSAQIGMPELIQVGTTLLQLPSSNSDGDRPPSSGFDFRSQVRMPNIELAALKQTPPGELSFSALAETPRNSTSSSIPEFGKGTAQSTFDFGSPWNFQPISQPPVINVQPTLEDYEESPACENETEHNYPSTPAKDTTKSESPEPTTPLQDASYGYALITPPSTSYSTQLPSAHHLIQAKLQNGLFTPPETPEVMRVPKTRADLPISPRSEPVDDYLQQPQLYSGSPAIIRKPLPLPRSEEEEITEKRGESAMPCSWCGNGTDDCHCGVSEQSQEVGVKVGCLSRLTNKWRRMKLKITRKV